MSAPKNLKYTKSHEWVRVEGDVAFIGITDYAQNELGDITYLELPDVGGLISADEPFGVVESVKAASDVYSPVDGEILERNEDAVASPEVVNSSPYDGAWLVKVLLKDPNQVDSLMSPEDYDAYAAEAAH